MNTKEIDLDVLLSELGILTNSVVSKLEKSILFHLYLQKDERLISDLIQKEIALIIESAQGLRENHLFNQIFREMGPPKSERSFVDRFVEAFCHAKFITPNVAEEYSAVFATFNFVRNSANSVDSSFMDRFEILRREHELRELPFIDFFIEALGCMRCLDLLYNIQVSNSTQWSPIGGAHSSENRTFSIIQNAFNSMDVKGWKYAFYNENDFNAYCFLLSQFFEHKEYELPGVMIKLRKNTKTAIAATLNGIYYVLGETMKKDHEFFDIVRVLEHFHEGLTDIQLCKTIQRQKNEIDELT